MWVYGLKYKWVATGKSWAAHAIAAIGTGLAHYSNWEQSGSSSSRSVNIEIAKCHHTIVREKYWLALLQSDELRPGSSLLRARGRLSQNNPQSNFCGEPQNRQGSLRITRPKPVQPATGRLKAKSILLVAGDGSRDTREQTQWLAQVCWSLHLRRPSPGDCQQEVAWLGYV